MTSLTSETSKEKKLKNWKTKDVYFISPTLIIPCGIGKDTFNNLLKPINHRLKDLISVGAVRWVKPLTLEDAISEEEITQNLLYFSKLNIHQKLFDHGLIYGLPSLRNPLHVKVIVIFDATNQSDVAKMGEYLQQLGHIIRVNIPKGTEISMPLVILGERKPDIQKLEDFWPRFGLSRIAIGGTFVEQTRVTQVCQHVLVSLIASEVENVLKFLTSQNQQSIKWITVGASVIQTNIDRMQSWLNLQILRNLIHPVLKEDITKEQERQIDLLIREKSVEFKTALLNDASIGIRESGWHITNDGYTVQECLLLSESQLWEPLFPYLSRLAPNKRLGSREEHDSLIKKIFNFVNIYLQTTYANFKTFIWRVNKTRSLFLPDRDRLSIILSNNYKKVKRVLESNLDYEFTNRYQNLLDVIASFIDNSLIRSTDIVQAIPHQLRPTGLKAASKAINIFIEELGKPDVIFQSRPVKPIPMINNQYLDITGDEDTLTTYFDLLRLMRFKRRHFSLIGMYIMLLPAWPVITGLLDLLTDLDLREATIVSSMFIVFLILLNWIIVWVRVNKLFEKIQRKIKLTLSERVIVIVANFLRKLKLISIAQLSHLGRFFNRLNELLNEKNQEIIDKLDTFNEESLIHDGETSLLLSDYDLVSGWIQEAIDISDSEADQFDNPITALISTKVWPLVDKPISELTLVNLITDLSERYTERVFRKGLLQPYVLAEKIEILSEGEKWQWMWQHAHPLGISYSDSNATAFTIFILENDLCLEGSSGSSSRYWKSEWFIARSRLPNEIGCLRGFIEWEPQ